MMIVAAVVSGAKNSLRRRCGSSPEQWVWGRDSKIPADLIDGSSEIASNHAVVHDKPRSIMIRTAARKAFVNIIHNDSLLRKPLLGRA